MASGVCTLNLMEGARADRTVGEKRALDRSSRSAARGVCDHGQMATDPAELLAAKRRQLNEQLAEMSAPPDEVGSISFGKRVGEGTSQAVDRLSAVPAHDKLQAMLSEIERAELKIADGTYGKCDVCGRDIGAARLEARPWATRCLEHAS